MIQLMNRFDLLKVWLDRNSFQDGLSNVAEQEVERYVHHKLANVEDFAGLRRVIVAIPDVLLRGSAAFIAGMLKVPEGTFKSPTMEAAYNIMLAGIVGTGRGLADIGDPKGEMLAKLDEIESEWTELCEHDLNMDYHVAEQVPGSTEVVCYCDALKPIVAAEHEAALRAGTNHSVVVVRLRKLTLPAALRAKKTPCPRCVLRRLSGKVSETTSKPKEKAWHEMLSQADLVRLIAIIRILKSDSRFDARAVAIIQADKEDTGWRTLPSIDAFRAATSFGLDDDGNPTYETARHFVDAVDIVGKGAPTSWSVVVSAFERGDFTPVKKMLATAWRAAVAASSPVKWYFAAFVASLLVFFIGGWVFGLWWLALPGAIGTFVCVKAFWVVEGFGSAVGGSVLTKDSDLQKRLNAPWLTNIARDLISFSFIYGGLLTIVCVLDGLWWSRLLLGVGALLNIANRYWIAKKFEEDEDSKVVKGWNKKTIAALGWVSLACTVIGVVGVAPNSWNGLRVRGHEVGGVVVVQEVLLGNVSHPVDSILGQDAFESGEAEMTDCKEGRNGLKTCYAVISAEQEVTLPFGYYTRKAEWLDTAYPGIPSGMIQVQYTTAWWKWCLLQFTPADPATAMARWAHGFSFARWLALIVVTAVLGLTALICVAGTPKSELGLSMKTFFIRASAIALVFLLGSLYFATSRLEGEPPSLLHRVYDNVAEEIVGFWDEESAAEGVSSVEGETGASAPAAPEASKAPAAAPQAPSATLPQAKISCDDPRVTPRIRAALGCSEPVQSSSKAPSVASKAKISCDDPRVTPRIRAAHACR